MWKSAVGHKTRMKVISQGGDDDTAQHVESDVPEPKRRSAPRSVEGLGHRDHASVSELRQKVSQELILLEKEKSNPSRGPGRALGHEKNAINKVVMGHSYTERMEVCSSQAHTALGCGGRLGMQKHQVDKLIMEFKCKDFVENHPHQQDAISGNSKGLGAKFSVQKLKEKVDKTAVRKNSRAEAEKPQCRSECPLMFGVKFVVEKEKVFILSNSTTTSDQQRPQKATRRVQFENLPQALDKDSRRRVEENRAKRQKREQEETRQQIQAPTSRREERQWTPLVLNGTKTPGAFTPLCKTLREESLPQQGLQVTSGSGPAVGGLAANSEEDGEYEDMRKAPVQEDESDYEDLTRRTTAVAMYNYRGEEEDEISFSVTDIITNIEMTDEAWWKGYCHGQFGYFPACFVQVIH